MVSWNFEKSEFINQATVENGVFRKKKKKKSIIKRKCMVENWWICAVCIVEETTN